MPHLIEPLANNTSYQGALTQLRAAHLHIVECCKNSIFNAVEHTHTWGILTKRLTVNLSTNAVPRLIGKDSEKYSEIANIMATTERLISALEWFSNEPKFKTLTIKECHPSTSDVEDGNDLVLVDSYGSIIVRCEVCDVASTNAGQNNKENRDLQNLGCADSVPSDGTTRFICTSPEFAKTLCNKKRRWNNKHYRYRLIDTNDPAKTCMLEILPFP